MFSNAIVRRPCRAMVDGITSAGLGKPDYKNALKQHDRYIEALESCKVKVKVLEALEKYPDSVFVEDTAVMTEKCAIITNPGAKARQGEEAAIKSAIGLYYQCIQSISAPGTLDGGDVMKVGDRFFVGLSARTNIEGFTQFEKIMNDWGYHATNVRMKEFLHLKTGVAYLENNNLLISGEFVDSPVFNDFNRIVIEPDESYAANCIWVNGNVLVPAGFSKTATAIESAGYPVIEVDVSEFRKLDGGLSCLSLRF